MSGKKQLHIHSVPLLLFALVVTAAIATVGIAGSTGYASSGTVALQALMRPMIKVAPNDNGVASIQLNRPPTDAERLRQALDEAIAKANTSTSTHAGTDAAQTSSAKAVGSDMSGLSLGTKLQLLVE
jgi:cytochrome c556